MRKTITLLVTVAILCSGLAIGLFSVHYAIHAIGSQSVAGNEAWRQWQLAAGRSSNPYALANFLLHGQVPPAQGLFQVYTRTTDDEGKGLHSDCTYEITADDFDSRWWSFSTEPSGGDPLSVTSVITSEDIVRPQEKSLSVQLSRFPVPGNWLRMGNVGTVSLKLVISNDNPSAPVAHVKFPSVKKLGCS